MSNTKKLLIGLGLLSATASTLTFASVIKTRNYFPSGYYEVVDNGKTFCAVTGTDAKAYYTCVPMRGVLDANVEGPAMDWWKAIDKANNGKGQ